VGKPSRLNSQAPVSIFRRYEENWSESRYLVSYKTRDGFGVKLAGTFSVSSIAASKNFLVRIAAVWCGLVRFGQFWCAGSRIAKGLPPPWGCKPGTPVTAALTLIAFGVQPVTNPPQTWDIAVTGRQRRQSSTSNFQFSHIQMLYKGEPSMGCWWLPPRPQGALIHQ
jgi:hypothetical protein